MVKNEYHKQRENENPKMIKNTHTFLKLELKLFHSINFIPINFKINSYSVCS